jgi:hypothetical protein
MRKDLSEAGNDLSRVHNFRAYKKDVLRRLRGLFTSARNSEFSDWRALQVNRLIQHAADLQINK